MEGLILGFDRETGAGVIRGDDGARFAFARSAWRSDREPVEGQRVDFVADGGVAREVYLLTPVRSFVTETVREIETSEKSLPTLVYALYLAAFFFGVSMVVGVVLAYVNRPRAEGTWLASHYDWQIATFWKSLIGVVLGVVLLVVWVGVLVLAATYVWVLYRIVKGWSALSAGQPVGVKP